MSLKDNSSKVFEDMIFFCENFFLHKKTNSYFLAVSFYLKASRNT